MNISIQFHTYNGTGASTLSHAGDVLLLNAPESFGSAITTVEIYANLRCEGPPLKTLEDMFKRHEERLATLPLAWKRARGLFQIAYLSKLGSAEKLLRNDEGREKPVSPALFREACREIVSALSNIRDRLKPKDDFDFEAFDSHLRRRLEQLPTKTSELETMLDEIRTKHRKEAAARQLAKIESLKLKPQKPKIFNSLNFHDHCKTKVPKALVRAFRLRINQIVDSFSMRIPKKMKSLLFHKLNVCAYEQTEEDKRFRECEGIACVDILVPDLVSLYRATRTRAIKRLKELLLEGIKIAAKYDFLFAEHLDVWKHLIATADQEFDFDLRMTRSHRSRRWRCDAVLRNCLHHYHYDVLVKDSKTLQTIQRHRIKTTECAFPFYRGVGFSNLRWDKEDIVVLTKDGDEVARFETKLPVS